jgi:hypothetical protein
LGAFRTPGIPGGTARSAYNSFQLTPHFDLNYELGFRWFSLLPFILSDCSIFFERPFKESGAGTFVFSACDKSASLNTQTDSFISFTLQSEAGVNLFEQLDLDKRGKFVFRQKLSYVNRYLVPYILRTKFLGDATFRKTNINIPMQHFFGSSLEMIYQIKNSFISLSYEGMVGSGFLTNTAYVQIGREF